MQSTYYIYILVLLAILTSKINALGCVGFKGKFYGKRDTRHDATCSDLVIRGTEGYCLCEKGRTTKHVKNTTQTRNFTCEEECFHIPDPSNVIKGACIEFVRTGKCHPNGPLLGALPCNTKIKPSMSGYCLCIHGLKARHVGCENEDKYHLVRRDFDCDHECSIAYGQYVDKPNPDIQLSATVDDEGENVSLKLNEATQAAMNLRKQEEENIAALAKQEIVENLRKQEEENIAALAKQEIVDSTIISDSLNDDVNGNQVASEISNEKSNLTFRRDSDEI